MSAMEATLMAAGRHHSTVGFPEPDGLPTWQWVTGGADGALRWLDPELQHQAVTCPPPVGDDVIAATVAFTRPDHSRHIYGVIREGITIGWSCDAAGALAPISDTSAVVALEADLASVLCGLGSLTDDDLAVAWLVTQIVELVGTMVTLARQGVVLPASTALPLLAELGATTKSTAPDMMHEPGMSLWAVGAMHAASTHTQLAAADQWLEPEVAATARHTIDGLVTQTLGHLLAAQ